MKILIDESVLREALEALKEAADWCGGSMTADKCDDAITELRETLDAAEKVEPVAYAAGTVSGYFIYRPINPAAVLPVGMAFYTHPAPAVPMSKDDAKNLAEAHAILTGAVPEETK